MWIDRHLILGHSDWEAMFANKRLTVLCYIAVAIGFCLLYVNDSKYIFYEEFSILTIYTIIIFITLSVLATAIYFHKYYMIPFAVILFNISFIIINLFQTFDLNQNILTITVCQSVMYFVINAIIFRLRSVFVLNFGVFFAVCLCAWQSFAMAEASGSQLTEPFMLNAIVLSAACLLLLHVVLTVRGMLIEQLGAARLQMAALEAEMEIESARQEARDKAVQLNRISVIEALGASIAHEINQPIAAALTYSQAARNWAAIECQSAQETLRAIAGVESNVGRAARLIENIRLLTTKKARVYALADIRDIVSDQIHLVQSEFDKRGIKIMLQPATSETVAVVCAAEIALAIINLLRNAMEAFDEPTANSIISIDCQKVGTSWIEVLIIDNGKGLAPDALQTAFSAFHSTKETGAGIGLSICQEVAEHHSGSISLTPNAGPGMTATLRLARTPDTI